MEDRGGSENTEKVQSVKLNASIASRINVAFHQNAVPTVSEIALINDTANDLNNVTISISSNPGFLRSKIFPLDHIRAGGMQRINPVPVDLDAPFFLNLTEAVRGEVSIVAKSGEVEIARLTSPCDLLSPSEWTGLTTAPELIVAFIQPNDPSIDAILRNAAEKLRQAGRDPSLNGYQSRKKARAWEITEAIWAALCDEKIVYALPPQSFEQNGQKVRWPSAILGRKIGTCLDLTLLFAACLEQAGLNPIVGFCEGHAFAGVWLKEEEFSLGTVDEPQTLRKRLQLEELVLVETTLLTNQPPVRFRAAVEKAATLVAEDAEKTFELVVDVRRARRHQIKPLALGGDAELGAVTITAGAGTAAVLDTPPSFAEEDEGPAAGPEDSLERLERWKRKLLDLSLRNRLLNFKLTKGAVPLVCPDPASVEDLLAEGKRVKLLPAADVMSGGDPRNAELHFRTSGDDAAKRYALEALQRGEIHANLRTDELDGRLTEIYRSARNSFEEGGANSLYLAMGFVSWTPHGKAQPCKAPLLLVPVALERRTVRSGFRLARHDDDPRINPTLLQMLRQDFKLVMPEFERELPVDASGLDVSRIWRTARTHFKDVKGFELTEDVVLSNFSFVKYLMWKDLVDRTDVLKRNPVVRHLIDTPKESYGDTAGLPDERSLDEEIHPHELFLPLPADSSQTAAVVAASRNKDFVLFGPPGTGKSQTIANIIVQLLAYGKTVLFVAAKTTALGVVRRRLDDIGLSSFCLEVYSAKAQKSSVLNQLKNAWEERATNSSLEWESATADLKVLRDKLNAVVRALHRRHRNGMTAHQAMGRVIASRDFLPGFSLPFSARDEHDEADIARLRDVCRAMRTALDSVGDPRRHPLAAIGRTEWSPIWQNQLTVKVRRFEEASVDLRNKVGAAWALVQAPTSNDPRRIRELLALVGQALKQEAESATLLVGRDSAEIKDAFSEWKRIHSRYLEIAVRLRCPYRDGAFALDLGALLNEWREAVNAMVLVRSGRKKRVRQALTPFADATPPDDVGGDISRLIELKALREVAQPYDDILGRLGHVWNGFATDAKQVDALFEWAGATTEMAGRLENGGQSAAFWIEAIVSLIRRCSRDPQQMNRTAAVVANLVKSYESFKIARQELAKFAETEDEWLGLPISEEWLTEAENTVQQWVDHASQLQRWCKWREISGMADKIGLHPLVSELTAGKLTPDQISFAFEIGYARWWAEQIVEHEDVLRTFVAEQHSDTIARFTELDGKVAALARQVVAGQLSGNIPSRTAFGRDPEFGTLAREIEKRARHIPLRQLFAQMPTALTKLSPCMMMSPLSVAQYLPPDSKPYDVIIFDEASQIPVWDAIGAIARGKQLIVVGDPKQLPPTTFFDRNNTDYDDSEDVEDLESILDECLGANIPHKRLAWHYRSRHESLIAFSNERYYDGRLVTFPSPVTNDQAVRYEHVPGGVYERGSGRVNREEACVVVQDIVRRLSDPMFDAEGASLGVVTFNSEQQRLIDTLLDQERRSQPALEKFFGPEWHEPVFVKNLESVQGDERDVILFSVGYGPDAAGRVSQNFGPLNKDGGERRLNVAITRARTELVVFATLRPDQIDLSRTKAAGVRDFKHFLEYAERGPRALAQASVPLDRDTESPFEDAVKNALEHRGWSVHPQVGVAGYRVDLGVVHPEAPGRYLAGIECDGATYHRAATARDRDLLRERVLRNLGWQIHRVWSTDWWVDSERALTTLIHALEKDLEADRLQAADATRRTTPEYPFVRDLEENERENTLAAETELEPDIDNGQGDPEAAGELRRRYAERVDTGIVPEPAGPEIGDMEAWYQAADIMSAGFSPDRNAFYDIAYRPVLRRMVAYVISVEGPIFDDLLVHRIARAHGFARSAGRIREVVLRAVQSQFPRSTEGKRRIFWPEGSDTRRPPVFRLSSPADRDQSLIPLVELSTLARGFLYGGAEPEEAVAMMARKLGLARVKEASRSRLMEAVKLARRRSE